jgi:hypothetical protein
MSGISVLTQTLMEGNVGKFIPLVDEALEAGRPTGEILKNELIAGHGACW